MSSFTGRSQHSSHLCAVSRFSEFGLNKPPVVSANSFQIYLTCSLTFSVCPPEAPEAEEVIQVSSVILIDCGI